MMMTWPWKRKKHLQETGLFGNMVSSSLCLNTQTPARHHVSFTSSVPSRPQFIRLDSVGEVVTSDEDWTLNNSTNMPNVASPCEGIKTTKMGNRPIGETLFGNIGNTIHSATNLCRLNGGGPNNNKRNFDEANRMMFGSAGANFGPLRYPHNYQQVYGPCYSQGPNYMGLPQNGLLPCPPGYGNVGPYMPYMPAHGTMFQPFPSVFSQFSAYNYPHMDHQNMNNQSPFHNQDGATRNGYYKNHRRQHKNHKHQCPQPQRTQIPKPPSMPQDPMSDLSTDMMQLNISSDSCLGSNPSDPQVPSDLKPPLDDHSLTAHPKPMNKQTITTQNVNMDSHIEKCEKNDRVFNFDASESESSEKCEKVHCAPMPHQEVKMEDFDVISDTTCDSVMASSGIDNTDKDTVGKVIDSQTFSVSIVMSAPTQDIIHFTAAPSSPTQATAQTPVDIRSLSKQRKKKKVPTATLR